MRSKYFFRTALAALILAAAAAAASAQTTTVTGKVTLKQADGTEVPVQGAQVDIYRTDIKQEFHTKTNKRGEFTHAGIPAIGTFTIAVSAPGARPTFTPGIPLGRVPDGHNFVLEPGDGSRLTPEQIKSAAAPAARAGSGAAAAPKESEEARKAREEYEREVKRVEEANKKVMETNAAVKAAFDAGNKAFTDKNYAEAVARYNEGLAADPSQAVLNLNKSLALQKLGVDKYNTAAKAKDTAGREAAREDLKNAVDSSEKAVKLYREQRAGGTSPTQGQPDETLNYLASRAEAYRLALQTSASIDPTAAVTAIEEYIAAEPDSAKKASWEGKLGQALFLSGRIEDSIAASRKVLASNPNNLDAIYWLGIALAADPAGAHAAEARDALKDFAAKAPATDTRKAEAEAAVAALEESLKPKPSSGSGSSSGGRRRKP